MNAFTFGSVPAHRVLVCVCVHNFLSAVRRQAYSAFQINHPPLGSGGGWQPSVIRQRGGVGLLNVHLCAWGWGWRASVMQHPGGVGVLDGTHGLGVGLGKLVRVGLGRLLAEGGGGGGALAPKTQLSQSPSQMPIPNPHTHSPNPQCPPMPIPNPNTHKYCGRSDFF